VGLKGTHNMNPVIPTKRNSNPSQSEGFIVLERS
jgi:hypothetical protein